MRIQKLSEYSYIYLVGMLQKRRSSKYYTDSNDDYVLFSQAIQDEKQY